MQFSLGIVGLGTFFCILLSFPETYHPGERGVDKVDPTSLPTWRPVVINPLRPLWLLRSPNLTFVVRNFLHLPSCGGLLTDAKTLAGFTALLADYGRISSP